MATPLAGARRQLPRPRRGAAAAALLACAGLGVAVIHGSSPRQLFAKPKIEGAAAPPSCCTPEGCNDELPLAELQLAMQQVDELRDEMEAGRSSKGFGERARTIIEALPFDLQGVIDGALQAIFVEQLTLLQEELLRKFENDEHWASVLKRADRMFVKRAEDLRRPGGAWTYEPERQALQVALEAAHRQEVALEQEKTRAAQAQRATATVVGKLQKQMEQVAEKINGAGGSSPWALWTSYRIPGMPLRMSGRYQQGRTNIEFSLHPNKDPANAEAGMVEGLFGKNIGLSLNLGV